MIDHFCFIVFLFLPAKIQNKGKSEEKKVKKLNKNKSKFILHFVRFALPLHFV